MLCVVPDMQRVVSQRIATDVVLVCVALTATATQMPCAGGILTAQPNAQPKQSTSRDIVD